MTNVVLITGIPGSGKTTVAKELAKKLSKSACIAGDELRESIIGGYKNPADTWNDETRNQYYLSFKNEASLASNFVNAGFTVIIDDVIHAGDLFEEWKKYFDNLSYQKVVLLPSKEICIKRNSERNKNIDENVISRLYEDFIKHDYSDWIIIDNSNQTIEETVKNIQEKLNWY